VVHKSRSGSRVGCQRTPQPHAAMNTGVSASVHGARCGAARAAGGGGRAGGRTSSASERAGGGGQKRKVSGVSSVLFSRVHPILPPRQPHAIGRNPRVSAAFHPDAHPRGRRARPAERGRLRQNPRYGDPRGHRQNRVRSVTALPADADTPQSVANLVPICPESGPNMRTPARKERGRMQEEMRQKHGGTQRKFSRCASFQRKRRRTRASLAPGPAGKRTVRRGHQDRQRAPCSLGR